MVSDEPRKVFVVFGTTGEWAEWPVAAYADEAMAERHATLAKEWYLANCCLEQYHRWDREYANPYDPDMRVDYTGTDWSVAPVEFRDALPLPAPPGDGG